MRRVLPLLLCGVLTGCGGGTDEAEEMEPGSEVAATEAVESEGPSEASVDPADACAPLDAELVEVDTEASDLSFGFSHPEGWQVASVVTQGVATVDLTRNTGERSYPDFLIRLQSRQEPMADWENQLTVWEQAFELEEQAAGSETLYLVEMGDDRRKAFQALLTEDDRAYRINAAITRMPDGCLEQGADVMREVLNSIRPL